MRELDNSMRPRNALSKPRLPSKKPEKRWWEAEANRAAGEIALLSINADAAKAEAHLERALTVARQQQAKSWELRAAMSMARVWRDQGKRNEAHALLA